MNPLSYAYGDDTPIAAIATVLGESALAVIRTSGKGAIDLLAKVFSQTEKLREAPGNTVVYGWILKASGENKKIDEVLVSVYREPQSYTGEDSADISCHGGIPTVKAVLQSLRNAGFRDALPGEFTFRAFMKGKLDLTKAESVMELVSAKTEEGRDHAVNRLSGSLKQEIQTIKLLLVQVLAQTELFLDYSEDEILDSDTNEAAGQVPDRLTAEEALTRLRALATSYRIERLYHDGALVVIAGQPNAGKSSLFNLLLKEDRSIVTDIPGTTRDWIEAWISLEGIPIRLADTAGLRDSHDPVEQIGVARSRELLKAADLILYLIDGTQGITPEDKAFFQAHGSGESQINKIIALWNKLDKAPLPESAPIFPLFKISAKTGEGLLELGTAIAAQLVNDSKSKEPACSFSPGIATERQKVLIDTAMVSLEEGLTLSDQGQSLDLIAPFLREAVNALGEITGEVSTAEILEVMFSRFCVGK
ncbi:MAG: tRNA uridine-5-carboxymethylaminomethyl(34) synthesis GTPase MnmE [Treponema sp.]|jgi:tRNA modification GTPase|nr:tRNA uridine-5-carboxymethylaminomethyl(34) synthesis GTPase MnmE [Treponema sp.]